MRGLSELVFSTTNQCTAHCQDCPIVNGGQPASRIPLDAIVKIVDKVSQWGTLKLVVFTGGEPFLLGDDLQKAVEYVAQKGIDTRIVSNAFWATSYEVASAVLKRFKESGLTEINFSCDDYHQEFVPIQNIKNANDAAVAIGLPALLANRKKKGGTITIDSLSEYLGVSLHHFKRGENNPPNNVILAGRNIPIDSICEPDDVYDDNATIDENDWKGACSSVLNKIVISPDLRVQICCGILKTSIPELYIGSLQNEDLLAILTRGNQDLITNWLALEGPSSILEFVQSKDDTIKCRKNYVSKCHLCNELFSRSDIREIVQQYATEKEDSLVLERGILECLNDI